MEARMYPCAAGFSTENSVTAFHGFGDVNVANPCSDNFAALGFNHSLNTHGRLNVCDYDSAAILLYGISGKRRKCAVKVDKTAFLVDEGYAVAIAVKGYANLSIKFLDDLRSIPQRFSSRFGTSRWK